MNIKLSVVIPARNEEDNIEETVNGLILFLNPHEAEVIVVNDHSTDGTRKIVKNLAEKCGFVKLVDNLKSPGFANALKTGFENASGVFVVPVMADRCDDPSTVPGMLEKASEGYDLICGSRYVRGGGRIGGPLVQGIFSRLVGVTLHLFTGIGTKDASKAFKMYRKEILLSLPLEEKGFAVSMEACVKFFMHGCRIADVPTVWYGRKKGKSKFRLSKTLPYIRLYLLTIVKKSPLTSILPLEGGGNRRG